MIGQSGDTLFDEIFYVERFWILRTTPKGIRRLVFELTKRLTACFPIEAQFQFGNVWLEP